MAEDRLLSMRLTTVATEQEAPAHIIAQLRTIDMEAELVLLRPARKGEEGRGLWILGVVQPDRRRANAAIRMIGRIRRHSPAKRDPVALRFWELVRDGFRQISQYHLDVESLSLVVADFRERDFNYRAELEKRLRETERVFDGTLAVERSTRNLRERAAAVSRDITRIVFRKRHSVQVHGLKGQ